MSVTTTEGGSEVDDNGRREVAAIVGLGYVGLPLAQAATGGGSTIIGFDVNASVVQGLKAGQSHVDDISDADVADMLMNGFAPTCDEADLDSAVVFVICVPTPLRPDGSPDLDPLVAAAETVARHVTPGNLVILESTTFPGTTDEVVLPILEASGLKVGNEICLAFSPERVDPGNPVFGIRNTPKVVGGFDEESTSRALAFYGSFVDETVPVKGTREAEMAKLIENTYRHINIALVNELARVCNELGIDVWESIRAAATKPFGFQAFQPGPGVGGHCIPIDPNYLSYAVQTKLGYPLRFVQLAQEINSTMPQYVARRAQDLLNESAVAFRGARVLLVGVTYKADIADQRESPADDLGVRLIEAGVELTYHDPFVSHWSARGRSVPALETLSDTAGRFDLAIILQHHSVFDPEALSRCAAAVLDTRGRLVGERVRHL